MLKAIIVIILSVVLVMSFSSCGQIVLDNDDESKTQKEERYEEKDDDNEDFELEEVPDEVTTIHTHTPTEATCLTASECEECGEVLADALGHDYVDGTCSRCGYVDPDSIPVGLEKLFVIDSYEYYFLTSPVTDSFGNSHTNVHSFQYPSISPYAIYNLNNEYSTFTGSIIMSTGVGAGTEVAITISVDDVVKYTKTGYTKFTDKVDFSVDVSGGKMLKISISGNAFEAPCCCIVNAQLTK